MKLYTQPGSFRAQKIIIAAQYAGQKLEIITDATAAAIKAKSPIAKFPLLEVTEGCIAESNAIARYIASLKQGSTLTGKSLLEKAQVDSWIDFCSNEIEVPATVWVYPIIGWMSYHHEASEKAKKDLKAALQVLESHLKSRTFMVGESITLADIALSSALLLPMKLVLDEKTRKPYPCVTRWFLTCVNQKEFAAVIGDVTLCKEALAVSGAEQEKPAAKAEKKADKKSEKKADKPAETKKKPEPKAADKDEEEEEPDYMKEEKKAKNPLDDLPKSSFVLDSWKREYSNPQGGDYYKSMPYLWANLDREGFSVYHANYKYNDELKVPFMVSNLATGFIQRCDEIRKYAFGVMQILGEAGNMEIRSTWIFRGPDEKLMLEVNPDADNYEWVKVTDLDNEATRKYIADMFCSGDKIDGKPILDGKVFK